jgi:pimeloyl-ACP methyl ester carboxylesterase
MQSHTATVDGINMRWEETGSGDPVILVHGIPASPALWRDVAPLIKGHRVLAWEMPGYGASIPEGLPCCLDAQSKYSTRSSGGP